MKKLSNWWLGACTALFCGISALPALAQESGPTLTIPELVPTTNLQQTLVTELQKWILIGLGIGIGVVLVYMGWRWIRRFMGR